MMLVIPLSMFGFIYRIWHYIFPIKQQQQTTTELLESIRERRRKRREKYGPYIKWRDAPKIESTRMELLEQNKVNNAREKYTQDVTCETEESIMDKLIANTQENKKRDQIQMEPPTKEPSPQLPTFDVPIETPPQTNINEFEQKIESLNETPQKIKKGRLVGELSPSRTYELRPRVKQQIVEIKQ